MHQHPRNHTHPDANAESDAEQVESLRVSPFTMALVVRAEDAVLADHMSVAILQKSAYSPDMAQLYQKWFNRGFTCPPIEVSDTQPVEVESMLGLFISFGAFAGAALLIAVGLRLHKHRQRVLRTPGVPVAEVGELAMSHTATEGEMLRMLLRMVESNGIKCEQRLEEMREAMAQPAAAAPGDLGGSAGSAGSCPRACASSEELAVKAKCYSSSWV